MKKSMMLLVTQSVMLISLAAEAGLLFNYAQLKTKDLDEMAKIVSKKVAESAAEGGDKSIPLKEALQAVYARPNEDFMIEKIVGPVKNALDEQQAYEEVVKELVKESIGALKNPKAFRPVIQNTYLVFLENLVLEFKPKIAQSFENGILVKVRDAEIEVTKQAKDERITRVMRAAISPSELAKGILEVKEKSDKEAAEAAEAAKKKSEDD
jgi:hypothetical protein